MKILHIKSVNLISTNGEDLKAVEYLRQLGVRHKCSVLSISLKVNYELTLSLIKKWPLRFQITEITESSVSCLSYGIPVKIMFATDISEIHVIIRYYLRQTIPDLIFTNFIDTVTLKVVQESGIPYYTFISDLTFTEKGALTPEKEEITGKVKNIAVLTEYTRKRLKYVLHKDSTVLPAPFNPELVRAEKTTRQFITLINPVPVKGVELFIRLAERLPEYLFLGVGGWNEQAAANFKKQARLIPNLKYLPVTDDMRKIYGLTRILLVPSTWEESFGRVCTEAMINGIPVITSDRGGLPEAVPFPEFNLPPDATDEWETMVRKLGDNNYYHYISEKMRQYSEKYLAYQKQSLADFEKKLEQLLNNETGV